MRKELIMYQKMLNIYQNNVSAVFEKYRNCVEKYASKIHFQNC